MGKPFIDRRQLLKLGLSSGVLASLTFACISLQDDNSAALLRFVSDSELPFDGTRTGVLRLTLVDRNLQVHGSDNLYACSNAVFPNVASANPTLTVAALAVRLAEHIDAA